MRRAVACCLLLAFGLAVGWWVVGSGRDGSPGVSGEPRPPEAEAAEGARTREARGPLRVVVVDAAGARVPRALLHVQRKGEGGGRTSLELDVVDGEVSFQRTGGEIRLKVTEPRAANGKALDLLPVRLRGVPQDVPVLTIELQGGRVLSGHVLHHDGTPASGVTVRTSRLEFRPDGLEARTDAQGRFSFRGLPHHTVAVRVVRTSSVLHPAPVTVAPEQTEVELRLCRVQDLEVEVQGPDGSPLAGVSVVVNWWAGGRLVVDQALSGWDGTCRVPGVAVGAVASLHANPGRGRGLPTVRTPRRKLPSGPLVVRIPPATFIEGRILDPEGRALVGAYVQADSLDEGWYARSRSREEGRFRVGPLAAGGYRLAVWTSPPRLVTPHPVEVRAPAADVELACVHRVPLRGRVVGEPLDVGTVRWLGEGQSARAADVEHDGSFAFAGVSPVPGALHVVAGETRRGALLVDLDPADAPFEVALVDCLEVAGRVEDLRPEPRGPLWLELRCGSFRAELEVARDGGFRSAPLPPGDYELSVQPGRRGRPPRTVRAGAHVVLTVRPE